ncbi:MAG: hypothetical protein ACYDEI_00255 [Erysipelotrichaceae bacterium]
MNKKIGSCSKDDWVYEFRRDAIIKFCLNERFNYIMPVETRNFTIRSGTYWVK